MLFVSLFFWLPASYKKLQIFFQFFLQDPIQIPILVLVITTQLYIAVFTVAFGVSQERGHKVTSKRSPGCRMEIDQVAKKKDGRLYLTQQSEDTDDERTKFIHPTPYRFEPGKRVLITSAMVIYMYLQHDTPPIRSDKEVPEVISVRG